MSSEAGAFHKALLDLMGEHARAIEPSEIAECMMRALRIVAVNYQCAPENFKAWLEFHTRTNEEWFALMETRKQGKLH